MEDAHRGVASLSKRVGTVLIGLSAAIDLTPSPQVELGQFQSLVQLAGER